MTFCDALYRFRKFFYMSNAFGANLLTLQSNATGFMTFRPAINILGLVFLHFER